MFRREPTPSFAPCKVKTSAINREDAHFKPCSLLQMQWEARASHTTPCSTYKPSTIAFCCLGVAPRQPAHNPCRDLTQAAGKKGAQTSKQSTHTSLRSHGSGPMPIPRPFRTCTHNQSTRNDRKSHVCSSYPINSVERNYQMFLGPSLSAAAAADAWQTPSTRSTPLDPTSSRKQKAVVEFCCFAVMLGGFLMLPKDSSN